MKRSYKKIIIKIVLIPPTRGKTQKQTRLSSIEANGNTNIATKNVSKVDRWPMGLRYSRKKRKLMENEGAKTNEKLRSTNTGGKNLTLGEAKRQTKKKNTMG